MYPMSEQKPWDDMACTQYAIPDPNVFTWLEKHANHKVAGTELQLVLPTSHTEAKIQQETSTIYITTFYL